MVNSFPTFARCFVFAAFAAVTFAAPPPLPDVRTPFRLGVFARQEVVRQSADDYTCGYKHIHMIQSPERDFQSLKIELDKTTFSGPTSDRFASIEIRLAGSVPKAAHQDITNLVRFAVTPVAEGLADVCVSLDHAGAAARSPSNRPVFFDCRVSLPRNVPEPAWNAATGVFDIWQTDVVRHVTFTLPDSLRKTASVQPMGQKGTPPIAWHLVWRVGVKDGDTFTVRMDLGAAPTFARKLAPRVGAIDFDRIDALHVPVKPTRNLIMNGGFEQGLKGWHILSPCGVSFSGYADPLANGGTCYEEIVPDAKFGQACVRFRNDIKGSPDPFASAPVSLNPGVPYVLSFWVKKISADGACSLEAAVVSAASKAKVVRPEGGRPSLYPRDLAAVWRRYSIPFMAPDDGGVQAFFRAKGVLLDGVQIEEGTAATDTVDDPVVAHLVTSDPRNDLVYGKPFDARLDLSGDGASGGVRVRAFNYYAETVFDRTINFASPYAPIPLDLDPEAVGQGVFVVRYDFTAEGKSWTDYERFAVTDPLKNEHPTAFFFLHYPFFQTHGSTGPALAKWMAARGMGSTSWPRNPDRMKPPLKDLYDTGKFRSGVHTLEHDLKARYPDIYTISHPGLRAWTNATPERVAFVEKEAYISGKMCDPADNMWAFSNEEECWSPIMKDGRFDEWFTLQYACWKGLKRAFDERGLVLLFAPTHGMSNYNPRRPDDTIKFGKRESFDGMLEAASKAGFRYNLISMHMYGAIDGSILSNRRRTGVPNANDRNANAEALFARLAHFGYDTSVPVRFEEGFNLLPFLIPAWGATGWGDAYDSTPPSQAYGNTEFVHAGAMARLYLMDLKYWPRVQTAHVWQHRPVMDYNLTPFMWTKVSNTLGHLLPDPRWVADSQPFPLVRAYVYRQKADGGEYGVLAIWTADNDVELGVKAGPKVALDLPTDAQFIDLMGNPRRRAGGDIPLTPAPLFVKSRDVSALMKAIGR